MEFLQSQIQDSCRLALPNGLKELMNDISREVLRAQPHNVFKFITNYLATLLVTRENLYIAARVCNVVCDCDCRPELEDELRFIGLDEEVTSEASKIILQFLGTDEVNEGNLLLKLVNKTSIDENQLPEVLLAIRKAFLRHQRNHNQIYEKSSSSDEDETATAARHTLGIYRQTEANIETFNCMARKIQASYRAYKVRREKGVEIKVKTDQLSHTPSRSESIKSTDDDTEGIDVTHSRTENLEKTKVTFGGFGEAKVVAIDHERRSKHGEIEPQEFEAAISMSKTMPSGTKLSSTSLAGSYLSLPQYKPYSAHDLETLVALEETPEKEHSNYDYTRDNSPIDRRYINDMSKQNMQEDKMFFDSLEEDWLEEESVGVEDLVDIDDVKFVEDIVEQIVMGNYDDGDNSEYVVIENIEEPVAIDGITEEGEVNVNIVKQGDVDENMSDIGEVDENIQERGEVDENIVKLGDVDDNMSDIDEVDENIQERGEVDENIVKLGDVDENMSDIGEVDENIQERGEVDDNIMKLGDVDENISELGEVDENIGVDINNLWNIEVEEDIADDIEPRDDINGLI